MFIRQILQSICKPWPMQTVTESCWLSKQVHTVKSSAHCQELLIAVADHWKSVCSCLSAEMISQSVLLLVFDLILFNRCHFTFAYYIRFLLILFSCFNFYFSTISATRFMRRQKGSPSCSVRWCNHWDLFAKVFLKMGNPVLLPWNYIKRSQIISFITATNCVALYTSLHCTAE